MLPGAGPGPPLSGAEAARLLASAHELVKAGRPLHALRVLAEVLRAAGLEREADESVARVQQALAAGSPSTEAAEELAGLLSLISLHAQAPQQQQHQLEQQQQYQQQQPSSMDVEGGTGPGPPSAHHPPPEASEASRLAGLAAAAEGASYVCPGCGGVVAIARQAAHAQLWCPALQGGPG